MTDASPNSFTDGRLRTIYFKTALPIIFVMGMNGLLSVANAVFLGVYVGPVALAAVTLMFPIYMLIVALSTLVSSGRAGLWSIQCTGSNGIHLFANHSALFTAIVCPVSKF
ncbi:MAG: hypothetical protein AAFY99_14105 [Pseudomonadota bacterium]